MPATSVSEYRVAAVRKPTGKRVKAISPALPRVLAEAWADGFNRGERRRPTGHIAVIELAEPKRQSRQARITLFDVVADGRLLLQGVDRACARGFCRTFNADLPKASQAKIVPALWQRVD